MIRELLWSYRQLFLLGVDSDETPETDYKRYLRESDQAWSALEAAFRHRPEFSREMLQDTSKSARKRIEDRLIEWTQDITWPMGNNNSPEGIWRSTAKTAGECSEKTSVFLQDRYWPFTKIIRFATTAIFSFGAKLAS